MTADAFSAVMGAGRSGNGGAHTRDDETYLAFLNGIPCSGDTLSVLQPTDDITLLVDEDKELIAVHRNLPNDKPSVWMRETHPCSDTLIACAKAAGCSISKWNKNSKEFTESIANNARVRHALVDAEIRTQHALVTSVAVKLTAEHRKELAFLRNHGRTSINHLAKKLYGESSLVRTKNTTRYLKECGLVEEYGRDMWRLTEDGVTASQYGML